MRLSHLRVKNIRSYRSGSLDLAAGTTLIAGDVGAGKTSLLYAIEMALFGTSEVNAAYLVRHGAPHAEVAVTLEGDGHRHEVARRFRRVRRKGRETFEPEGISFSTDGAKTEYSATELRQRVIELMGFPDNPNPTAHSDLWRWAVYVPQERMREILAAEPQERLDTVRKALGVEKYRTAADNAEDLAADLRRSARARRAEADLLRHFDEEFASATEESDRLRVERAAVEVSVARRAQELGEVRSEFESAGNAVRSIEVDSRELEGLRREIAADHEALDRGARAREERIVRIAEEERAAAGARAESGRGPEARAALAAADADLTRFRAELDALSPDLSQLATARAELAAAGRRVAPADEAIARAARELAEARALLDRSERDGPTHEPPAPTPRSLEAIDRELEELRDRERGALAATTRAQTAVQEFDELLRAGVCPRCGQAVHPSEFEPHKEEAARLSRDAEERFERATADRSRTEDERRSRERFERAHERWTRAERDRSAGRDAMTEAERRVTAAERERAELASAIASAQANAERWSLSERRQETLRARVRESEAERDRLARDVERTAVAAETSRAAEATLRALAAEIARLEGEAAALRDRTAGSERRAGELTKRLEGAESKQRRLSEVEARLRDSERSLEADRHQLVRVDTRLDAAAQRVTAAEHGRAERARRTAAAVDLESKATWTAGPFREAVLLMEQKILAHAQATLERNFSRYFAALVDDPALVARVDTAFTPAVAIEGEWTPAEALSGGERTSLALAFRLALAQVVRSLGSLRLETILLDEPTDGFSPEQVVRMGELLDELALPQVILVSHENELAAIADRVVRVEKVDGTSRILKGGAALETEDAPDGAS